MENKTKKQDENIDSRTEKLLLSDVTYLVCMNLKRTCSSLDAGKCNMVKAMCVFQQICV
jgi:hypothetical protein